MTVDVNTDIRDAAVSGIINILVQPEYGTDYLKEVIRSVVGKDADITEDMVTAVDDLIAAKMNQIAASLVSELDESRQGQWDFLSKQG